MSALERVGKLRLLQASPSPEQLVRLTFLSTLNIAQSDITCYDQAAEWENRPNFDQLYICYHWTLKNMINCTEFFSNLTQLPHLMLAGPGLVLIRDLSTYYPVFSRECLTNHGQTCQHQGNWVRFEIGPSSLLLFQNFVHDENICEAVWHRRNFPTLSQSEDCYWMGQLLEALWVRVGRSDHWWPLTFVSITAGRVIQILSIYYFNWCFGTLGWVFTLAGLVLACAQLDCHSIHKSLS